MTLALNESREVSLVIDSERDLEGATIRLFVTGSVALAGYEQQQETRVAGDAYRRARTCCRCRWSGARRVTDAWWRKSSTKAGRGA